MSDALLVSTRKGLFTVARNAGQWKIAGVEFLGDNVTLTLTDRRDGRRYAALDHGHFGVKLHRSTPTGREEIAVMSRTTCGAGRSRGARHAYGRWKRAAPTSPA